MFSLTSIFTTRHWNNEVHHLHSTPQQVSLTKGLHAARAPTRPPTKWAEWLMPSLVPHAWICRTNKQAETFQQLCVVFQNAWCFCWNRNVKTDVRFKEVWTIATSPDLLVQYMYRFIYIYIFIVLILVPRLRCSCVSVCVPCTWGLDQEDGRCTQFFQHVGNYRAANYIVCGKWGNHNKPYKNALT